MESTSTSALADLVRRAQRGDEAAEISSLLEATNARVLALLTPAQWECVALFTWGLYVVFRILGNNKRGFDPASLVMHPSLKKKPAPKKLEPAAAT